MGKHKHITHPFRRRPSSFRTRLFLISTSITLLAALIIGLLLERQLQPLFEQEIDSQLAKHLAATHFLLLQQPSLDSQSLQPLFDDFADTMLVRITIINEKGQIIADSELSINELHTIEPHNNRPEVLQAKASGFGRAERFSNTLRKRMLYLAIPFIHPQGQGTLRVSMPLTRAEELASHLRPILIITTFVALIIALLASASAAQLITKTLRQLVSKAKSLAAQSSIKITGSGLDEIGLISKSLSTLSQELERHIDIMAFERNRFESVLESMSEGVLAFDSNTRLTLINRAAKRLFGLPHNADPNFPRHFNKNRDFNILKAALSKANKETIELQLSEGRTALAWIAPQYSGGHVVAIHEVTKLRRLENIRTDFVANVSHELRTPVSVIKANAEILLDEELVTDPDAKHFLDAVLRNTERLSDIITNLLEVAKIEAGKASFKPEPVAMTVLCQRLKGDLKQLNRPLPSIQFDCSPDCIVLADEQALYQALNNIIDNAIKYTPSEAQVDILIHSRGEQAIIEIADQGPGIPTEFQNQVFERFFRIKDKRKRKPGTGLGLAIVKHLILSMGGQVGVRANTPNGAVFWITLPTAKE